MPACNRCATGRPDCSGRRWTSKRTREAAVSLEVGFRSPRGEPRRITYDLNAGAPFIKTTVSGGVDKLRVQAPCRFAVLPDFFADDIVVDASAIRGLRSRSCPARTSSCTCCPAGTPS